MDPDKIINGEVTNTDTTLPQPNPATTLSTDPTQSGAMLTTPNDSIENAPVTANISANTLPPIEVSDAVSSDLPSIETNNSISNTPATTEPVSSSPVTPDLSQSAATPLNRNLSENNLPPINKSLPDNTLPPIQPAVSKAEIKTEITKVENTKNEKGSNTMFIVIVAILVLAIIAAVVFTIYTLSNNDNNDANQPTQTAEYNDPNNPEPENALPTKTYCQSIGTETGSKNVCIQLITGWVNTASQSGNSLSFIDQAQIGSATGEDEKITVNIQNTSKTTDLNASYLAYQSSLCIDDQTCAENIKVSDKLNNITAIYSETDGAQRKFLVVSFQTETDSWNASASIPLAQVDKYAETLKYSLRSITVK